MKRSRIKHRAMDPAERARRDEVRRAVFRRDVRCLLRDHADAGSCFGPLTPHHRKKSGQGGAYDEANIITICSGHNDGWIEDHPNEAKALGLTVSSWESTNAGIERLDWIPKDIWIEIAAATDDEDNCLIWPWAKDDYGRVGVRGSSRSEAVHHRVIEATGRARADWQGRREQTRHLCGNGHCANPHHLVVGSCSENQLDRREHGTDNGGERNGRTRLTQEDADQIRREYVVFRDTPPMRTNVPALAREYEVSHETIRRIINGRTFT